VVIDSRSCRSAPSRSERGIDGGKKIRGVKIQVTVDKYGIPLVIDVNAGEPAWQKAIVPVLRELAGGGFRGPAFGDLGYRGERLAKAGKALGITVEAIARGRGGQFVPAGICWAVKRSFAWLSRYRRLNTIFERSKEHLIAFVEIAFISILSRRMKRLVVEEVRAWLLQTGTEAIRGATVKPSLQLIGDICGRPDKWWHCTPVDETTSDLPDGETLIGKVLHTFELQRLLRLCPDGEPGVASGAAKSMARGDAYQAIHDTLQGQTALPTGRAETTARVLDRPGYQRLSPWLGVATDCCCR
jgi:hypothetical protein